MKYRLLIPMLSILMVLGLAGCQTNDTDEEETVDIPVQKNMELQTNEKETHEDAKPDPDSPSATYKVKEGEYETFLADYEKDLAEDGWEVTMDAKPDFLILIKDSKEIKIMPVQSEEEITVHVYETEIEEAKE